MTKIERITFGKINHENGGPLEVPIEVELVLYDINRKKKTFKYEYSGLDQGILTTYLVDMDVNLSPRSEERRNVYLKVRAFGNHYFIQDVIVENHQSRLDLELILSGPLINWSAKLL